MYLLYRNFSTAHAFIWSGWKLSIENMPCYFGAKHGDIFQVRMTWIPFPSIGYFTQKKLTLMVFNSSTNQYSFFLVINRKRTWNLIRKSLCTRFHTRNSSWIIGFYSINGLYRWRVGDIRRRVGCNQLVSIRQSLQRFLHGTDHELQFSIRSTRYGLSHENFTARSMSYQTHWGFIIHNYLIKWGLMSLSMILACNFSVTMVCLSSFCLSSTISHLHQTPNQFLNLWKKRWTQLLM